MKTKAISPILEAVHEIASGLYKSGFIDEHQMREFDESCLEPEPAPEYSSEQVRALRERWELSEAELAGKLNVSPATVRRWEVGKTRPRGPVLLLLELLDRKGLEALSR
jgi:putative transcriptional regulator